MGWSKHLPPLKESRRDHLASSRVNSSNESLRIRPEPEDWYNVRFSDEHHEGFGPVHRQLIARNPGKARRFRSGNVQHRLEPAEKDKNQIQVWAAVGNNFKFKLLVYFVSTNQNGKMTNQEYLNIQERLNSAASWLARGDQFALEEDRDLAHGTGQASILESGRSELAFSITSTLQDHEI